MNTTPKVNFKNADSARALSDKEIDDRLARGALISNTALSIRQARQRPGFGTPLAYAGLRLSRQPFAFHRPRHAHAGQVSDPHLDRSDESAIAINPRNHRNIVAGAVSSDGTVFTNTAYVTKDGGRTWKTVTVLTNADEGAGIAFDDSGNCYYTTMQGGLSPVCVVSRDGGLTWSVPANFGFGDKTAVSARGQTALCGFDRVNSEACAFTLTEASPGLSMISPTRA